MKLLLWIFAIVAFIFGFSYYQFHTVVSDREGPVTFEIPPSDPLFEIADNLRSKKLIRSPLLFRWYAEWKNLDTKIQAGRFHLDPTLTAKGVLLALTNPDTREIMVTIPEGFTIFEIDEKLASLGLIVEKEFIQWAQAQGIEEGMLFPDTYSVYVNNFAPEDLGKKMHATFQKKVMESLGGELKTTSRTLSEIITMASILEKEVRTEKDIPIVAGILWKRLDNGWPLQADATLLYGKKNRVLMNAAEEEDSPYNTYSRKGLPLTAIGNPGLRAIRAALSPVESEYWFYLTGNNEVVHYAKTNEEHNKNKRFL